MEDTKGDQKNNGKSDNVKCSHCNDKGLNKCSFQLPSIIRKRPSSSSSTLDLFAFRCPGKKVNNNCDHQEQDGMFTLRLGQFVPENRPEERGEGKDTTKTDEGLNMIIDNSNTHTYEVGSSSSSSPPLPQTWRQAHDQWAADHRFESSSTIEFTLLPAGDVPRKKEKRKPKPKPRKEDYPSSPTPLPQQVMDIINQTRGGNSGPIHVSTKRITRTDVDRHQARLNITDPGKLMSVFTSDELNNLNEESIGLEVKVMDACGRRYTMRMRKRSYCVAIPLNHEWNQFVSQNGLEDDDWVEMWWFREANGEICLVLNVIKKRRDDDGNDGGGTSSSNSHGDEGGSGSSSVACHRKFYNFF